MSRTRKRCQTDPFIAAAPASTIQCASVTHAAAAADGVSRLQLQPEQGQRPGRSNITTAGSQFVIRPCSKDRTTFSYTDSHGPSETSSDSIPVRKSLPGGFERLRIDRPHVVEWNGHEISTGVCLVDEVHMRLAARQSFSARARQQTTDDG